MAETDKFVVQIIFHRAQSLPVADIHNLSCDPFIEATVSNRIIDDAIEPGETPLIWRTQTIHRTRDPIWEAQWTIGGVPGTGFSLRMRLKDEDETGRDDRLGKAYLHVTTDMMKVGAQLKDHECKIWKRKGNFRPWIQTYITSVIPGQHLRKHGRVFVTVRVLDKDKKCGYLRMHTVGPSNIHEPSYYELF